MSAAGKEDGGKREKKKEKAVTVAVARNSPPSAGFMYLKVKTVTHPFANLKVHLCLLLPPHPHITVAPPTPRGLFVHLRSGLPY